MDLIPGLVYIYSVHMRILYENHLFGPLGYIPIMGVRGNWEGSIHELSGYGFLWP